MIDLFTEEEGEEGERGSEPPCTKPAVTPPAVSSARVGRARSNSETKPVRYGYKYLARIE